MAWRVLVVGNGGLLTRSQGFRFLISGFVGFRIPFLAGGLRELAYLGLGAGG